jgi:hypothetical protein
MPREDVRQRLQEARRALEAVRTEGVASPRLWEFLEAAWTALNAIADRLEGPWDPHEVPTRRTGSSADKLKSVHLPEPGHDERVKDLLKGGKDK